MEEAFDGLRKELERLDWPSLYFFKFICPSNSETIAKVTNMFGDSGDMKFQPSKNGNYTSISIKEVMMSADDVIAIYVKAASIKGVMAL
jgi:uncharacterized protein